VYLHANHLLDLVGDLRMIRWLMDWGIGSEISTVPKLGRHSSGNSGGILSRREQKYHSGVSPELT
jgi:hypothetical protein